MESWLDFSVRHASFALHRLTGWLLLGWVVVHLGLPVLGSGPAVWNPLEQFPGPVSQAIVVGLFAVLVFHAFNGVRLIAAELLGVGIGAAKQTFQVTLVACVALTLGLEVML